MKLLFCTNLPSPYRVDFFNELGKYCDLTVCFERESATDRDREWRAEAIKNFKAIFLSLKPVGADLSRGSALKNHIKNNIFDFLILTNYVSPATMQAIIYCRLKKIPYYIEYDGGFNKKDVFYKRILKKILLCGASGHFVTCQESIDYLNGLGISNTNIFKYPFTSIKSLDVLDRKISEEKKYLREKLNMTEDKIIISVGRFSYLNGYGKGYDALMHCSKLLDKNVGWYIIGGEPTTEFSNWKKQENLNNVHFIDFKSKSDLKEYYKAADIFVLMTIADVWGLVINEAMSMGLPVITTDKCVAGLELVKNGENGYIIPVNDIQSLANCLKIMLNNDLLMQNMGEKSLNIIREYTIENMVKVHMNEFKKINKKGIL